MDPHFHLSIFATSGHFLPIGAPIQCVNLISMAGQIFH